MNNLLFSINAVAPVFLIVLLGMFLKKIKIINDNFVTISVDIVFKFALPALIFSEIARTDFRSVFDAGVIIYSVIGTVILVLVLYAVTSHIIKDKRAKGAFVQGVFRSNFAIIGLPLIFNLFGQTGLAKSAVLLAFIMPLYNITAVVLLTVTSSEVSAKGNMKILLGIIKNPLILAVVLAFPFSYFNITLPYFISKTMDYMSALTTPLALLGIGCFFTFAGVRKRVGISVAATLLRILATPLIFTIIAYFIGFRGDALGSIFILFGSPTAVSSFIMAKAMGSDSELAAHIVLMTTLGSALTIFSGVLILRSIGAI